MRLEEIKSIVHRFCSVCILLEHVKHMQLIFHYGQLSRHTMFKQGFMRSLRLLLGHMIVSRAVDEERRCVIPASTDMCQGTDAFYLLSGRLGGCRDSLLARVICAPESVEEDAQGLALPVHVANYPGSGILERHSAPERV